jgi:hypothetical protein
MSFEAQRRSYCDSSVKLRRARRLYKYLVAKAIIKNPELSFVLAVKAINAGLYSFNTSLNDVVFSLWRGAHKYDYNSLDWCRVPDCIWFQAKYYFKRTESGYVQIKKIRIRL